MLAMLQAADCQRIRPGVHVHVHVYMFAMLDARCSMLDAAC